MFYWKLKRLLLTRPSNITVWAGDVPAWRGRRESIHGGLTAASLLPTPHQAGTSPAAEHPALTVAGLIIGVTPITNEYISCSAGFAETVGRTDAAVELTGMYSQRVLANPTG